MTEYLSRCRSTRSLYHVTYVSLTVGVAGGLIVGLITAGLPQGSVHKPALLTVLAVGFASLVTLYPLVRTLLTGGDILQPSVVVGGLLFAYFPLRAAGVAFLDLPPAFPSFRAAAGRSLPAFTFGLIVIGAGAVAFYVGYRVTLRETNGAAWPRISRRHVLTGNLLIVWTLSVSIEILSTLNVVTSANALVHHVTNLHVLVVLIILASYFRTSGSVTGWRLPTVVLAVETAVVTLVDFNLNSLLGLLTMAVLAYHYLGPGISVRKFATASGGIVVLFPISEIGENLQAGQDLTEALAVAEPGLLYVDAFLRRMIGTDALTMIVHRTPEPVPFRGGETLLWAVYGLVPRAIWPGKPNIIMCGLNNRYFSGRGASADTCAAMTVPGELYWNFGVLGVVVGLFTIGLLLGGTYRWFRYGNGGPSNYALLVVYAIVLLPVMRFESGVAQLVSNLIKDLGFAVVLLWFTTAARNGEPTISLDGDSALERSQIYRITVTAAARLRATPIRSSRWLHRLRTWLLAVPRRCAEVIEASAVYRAAVTVDRVVAMSTAHTRSSLQQAWQSSLIRRTITGSWMYRSLVSGD